MTIQEYLESKEIQYWESGKNISRGWIGMRCIFPGCGDQSNHLGINLTDGRFKCWKCGRGGSLKSLLRALGEPTRSTIDLLKEIALDTPNSTPQMVFENRGDLNFLMSDFLPYLDLPYRKYLTSRGYDPDFLQKKYNLFSSGITGKYKFRVIIPIKYRNQIVGFTGRDITEKAKLKYFNSPDSHNLIPREQWLFNIDSVKKRALIVEGWFDSMNMGDGTIAILTTAFSPYQVKEIIKLNLEACFIMFDGEQQAIEQAYKLSYELAPFIDHVEVFELSNNKDPGGFSQNEVMEIRREIF